MGRRSLSAGPASTSRRTTEGGCTNKRYIEPIVLAKCANCDTIGEKLTDPVNEFIRFCENCLNIPLVKCMQTFVGQCEKQRSLYEEQTKITIAQFEKKISQLETQVLALTSPNPKPRKRAKLSSIISPQAQDELPLLKTSTASPNSPELSSAFVCKEQYSTDKSYADVVRQPTQNTSTSIRSTAQMPRTPNAYQQRTTKAENVLDLTVICTNVPEPTAKSLKERHQEEIQKWNELSNLMGVSVEPVSLTRLSRPPSSGHAGEPRLLRIQLKSLVDVEDVLLSAHILRSASLKTRIFPDIPWSQRQEKKENPEKAKKASEKKTVLIHGIPESQATDEKGKRAHDCQEWKFIQELIGTKDIVTTSVSRLPHSPNYKGTGPRILRVSMLQEEMVTSMLETWYVKRRLAPPELRIHTPDGRSKKTGKTKLLEPIGNQKPLTKEQEPLIKINGTTTSEDVETDPKNLE